MRYVGFIAHYELISHRRKELSNRRNVKTSKGGRDYKIKATFIKHIQLQPAKEDEVVVKVTASGYHHLVRGRASGNHYSVLGGEDDRIVGVDGVGYIEGKNDLVYFTTFAPGLGSYAEYVNVKKENVHQFPSNYTSKEAIARVAALSNGVMSSYFALGPRMPTLVKNPIVAILGVTGTSGQLAIQVSKNIFNA